MDRKEKEVNTQEFDLIDLLHLFIVTLRSIWNGCSIADVWGVEGRGCELRHGLQVFIIKCATNVIAS